MYEEGVTYGVEGIYSVSVHQGLKECIQLRGRTGFAVALFEMRV